MNKTLLFLVLVPLILFAGFSAYYQETLKNISTEYGQNREQLEKVTGELILEETKANESLQVKETVQKDKEVLEKGFNELKNENLVLKKEKSSLEQELISVKSELQKTKSEVQEEKEKFNLLKLRFDAVEKGLIKANEEISRLIARIKELCSSGCSDDQC